MEHAIDLDVASFDEATGATDEALAGLGDSTHGGVEAQLGALRGAVTAGSAERSLAATATAEPVVAEYTALIQGVLDADDAEALGIDDPELRRGAHLLDLSAGQGAQVADTYRRSLLAGATPPVTPESIAAQARGLADVVSGAAELEGLATGGYAALADQHLPDDDLASLVSTLEAGMATDPAPVAMLAQSSGTAADVVAGYAAFGDGVQAAVDQRADDLEADAGVRRLVMLALAAAAVVGAVAAGVLLAVLLQRRVAVPGAG